MDRRALDEHLERVLVGGREKREIVVVPYDPAWPARFAREAARIRAALGPVAQRVEHIGSTAVPGLAAKPIVDVLVLVADPDDEARYGPALERAGYVVRVREPGHRMLRTPELDVHVHVLAPESPEAEEHLLLRDWLRRAPEDREAYARLKRELARREWDDLNHYAEAKGPLIAELRARARRNGRSSGTNASGPE